MRKYFALGLLALFALIIALVPACGGSSGNTVNNPGGQAGKATKLVFIVQPGGAKARQIFTTQPQVAIQDKDGNTVTSATNIVTLTIVGPVLSGKKEVNAVDGIAKFSDIALDAAGDGYTFTATSYGLEGATSNPFSVEP
jgi:hypothetical protein